MLIFHGLFPVTGGLKASKESSEIAGRYRGG